MIDISFIGLVFFSNLMSLAMVMQLYSKISSTHALDAFIVFSVLMSCFTCNEILHGIACLRDKTLF